MLLLNSTAWHQRQANQAKHRVRLIDIRHTPEIATMFALKDRQLATVMTAADKLPVEKRGVLLQRVVASLSQRGTGFNDNDLDDAMRRALVGLIQNSTA